ncbi:MAG: NAD(P)/FAD-dependent oxidoreductase [Pseudomonadota bacterium]|nr:NAD(P)/FAD-dependent oxidoreductase [Pseudomonadota bacterium]
MNETNRPHVVIVGAGFGGLSTARALAKAPVDITIVDRRNFHLFQPLLYQVATAELNPSDVAWPIRGVLRDQKNACVLLGDVQDVDRDQQQVQLKDGRSLRYDWLVLATGATHNYFGHDEWAPSAPGLKRIDDATLIRRRLLMAFERAENSQDEAERQALMTFCVIGAGPTGVEMAGAIAELAKHALVSDFHLINPRDARIVLLEGGPRVLPPFPESLSTFTQRSLERMGVEVMLNALVTNCDARGVDVGDVHLEARTVIWAAGVAASPAARWLGSAADRAGRALVEPDLSIKDLPTVFVIGDTAAMKSADGKPVPGIAPAAKQAGQHVAKVIRAAVSGKPHPGAFRYRHYGNLATIGRNSAVIDFGRIRMKGTFAWLLWCVAHIYFLIGARNRMLVAYEWSINYLTHNRGARLIVGSDANTEQRVP